MTATAYHITVPAPLGPSGRTSRLGAVLVGGVIIVHGVLHLFGAVSGLSWADVPTLTQPASTRMGVAWLLAAGVTVGRERCSSHRCVGGGRGGGRAVPARDRAQLECCGLHHGDERGARCRRGLRLCRSRPEQVPDRVPTPSR